MSGKPCAVKVAVQEPGLEGVILERMHTHPMSISKPSPADLAHHILHAQMGGGGDLSIIYRDLASGEAMVRRLDYNRVIVMFFNGAYWSLLPQH